MRPNSSKDFIIANLGYRLGLYYPTASIQVGVGYSDADVLVIQPHTKMPDRDAITGALKNFNMLNAAYRATSQIVSCDRKDRHEINRYHLKELIGIIKPLIVVACGPEVTSLLKKRRIRSFKGHTGKRFHVADLTNCTFYATLNPVEYGFACAPKSLKAQGKAEWSKLAAIYRKLKDKRDRERWTC